MPPKSSTLPGARQTQTGTPQGASVGCVQFKPKGKPFKQRVDAFVQHAKLTLKVNVSFASKNRTAKRQQTLHVAHMFLYNEYKSAKPAHTENGKKTIGWKHFSDVMTEWSIISSSEFLRTKGNKVPERNGRKWKPGCEPDQAATRRHCKALLTSAGVGNNGTAMAAPGTKPCGSPCGCGASRSKHVSGLAVDLKKASLTALSSALRKAKAGSIDAYLKKFGLHRPLKNHPKSPEPWHIESM